MNQRVESARLELAQSTGTQTDPAGARSWTTKRDEKRRRLAAIEPWLEDGILPSHRIVEALETLIRPGDRVALEGDNQKQADFLSRSFAKVDPQKVHDVHLLISSISRPEHLTLFEKNIAHKVDFSFAGPQSLRVAQLLEDGLLEIGAIYTYVELYARMFVDLTPNVALLCAEKADRHGNLYTGPNTEDTPTIAEAAAFRHGIVIVQVNEIVDELPRVDIPASWVDVVVQADDPAVLSDLAAKVQTMVQGTAGTSDVTNNLAQAQPTVRITVDRAKAAAAGLSETTVAGTVAAIMSPQPIGTVNLGDGPIDVTVVAAKAPATVAQLQQVVLPSATGMVPLTSVATVETVDVPTSITRIDGHRAATISATPSGHASRPPPTRPKLTVTASGQLISMSVSGGA